MKPDDDTDMFGMLAGVGIPLIQACAMMPGLFPCLLLLGVFALPLLLPVVALAIVGGVLIGIPAAIWALGKRVARLATKREPRQEVIAQRAST